MCVRQLGEMKRPPTSPQRYRIHYRDGRVETVKAASWVQVRTNHVFDCEEGPLRVPTDVVLKVESLNIDPMQAGRRRV